jgi:hypothetical protein
VVRRSVGYRRFEGLEAAAVLVHYVPIFGTVLRTQLIRFGRYFDDIERPFRINHFHDAPVVEQPNSEHREYPYLTLTSSDNRTDPGCDNCCTRLTLVEHFATTGPPAELHKQRVRFPEFPINLRRQHFGD